MPPALQVCKHLCRAHRGSPSANAKAVVPALGPHASIPREDVVVNHTPCQGNTFSSGFKTHPPLAVLLPPPPASEYSPLSWFWGPWAPEPWRSSASCPPQLPFLRPHLDPPLPSLGDLSPPASLHADGSRSHPRAPQEPQTLNAPPHVSISPRPALPGEWCHPAARARDPVACSLSLALDSHRGPCTHLLSSHFLLSWPLPPPQLPHPHLGAAS